MRTLLHFSAFEHGDGDQQDLVLKELALVNLELETSQSWIFLPPYPFEELTLALKFGNEYISRHSYGLRWDDGDVPYMDLKKVLTTYTEGSGTLYTFGKARQKFLEEILQRTVINLQELRCPKYSDLSFPTKSCVHPLHQFRKYRCALREAKCYAQFIKYSDLSLHILPRRQPTPITEPDVD